MTYEVDYIIKVLNAGAPQAINAMAQAVNSLGPGISVLDRLNKRIKTLNSSISGKQRNLTINIAPAEKSLTTLEQHINRIQQKLHLVSTYGGGKSGKGSATSGGRGSSAQPRDMWKHGSSLYARGNTAPNIPLPKGQKWRRGLIPYEALNARELQMWRQIENQQARLQKRMNRQASKAWKSAGGRKTGLSKSEFARQYAQNGGYAEYSLWTQGNSRLQNLRKGWVNSYSGPMSSGGRVPSSPIPMPFTSPTPTNGANKGTGSRRGIRSNSGPKNVGYKFFGPTPFANNGGMAIDMLKGMGIAYGLSGIGQLMSNVINDAVVYDNTMTTVENILSSNDKGSNFQGRFYRMQKTVRDVGLKTKFKVTEVADAAKFLAMAGLSVDAINEAINPIADLSLIGDTDLGETADLVTNIMTAYNIPARKMRNAADVMTKTFTSTNVTLPEIAESFKYAAGPLSAGGIDFEEATAAIGILGDAGMKGSQAGTTLRTLMSNVVNPRGKAKQGKWKELEISKYDEDGNFKSLNDVFNELADKHLGVDDYYKLFDKTAAQGAIALAMHVDKWNKVIEDNFMSDGISERIADAKKNTIQGLWAQLTSSFSDDGLGGFGAIQENVKTLLRTVTSFLQSEEGKEKINGIFQVFWNFVEVISHATSYLFGFFDKFSGIITFWMKVQLVMWPIIKTFTALKSVLLGFVGIGQIIGKIGLLSMNLRTLMLTMGGWRTFGALGLDSIAYAITGGLKGRKFSLLSPGGVVSSKGIENYSTTWSGGASYGSGASGNVVYPNGVPAPQAPKGNRSFWKKHKGAAFKTGAAGVLGMGLGAYAGDKIGGYFNGDGSSTVGSIIGGVAGTAMMTSVGSWLAGAAPALFTNPVGWGVLAVGAVVGLVSAIWKSNEAIKEANRNSIKWAQTANNFYLDQIDWTKDNAIVVANMRLTTGSISDMNTQLRLGIANWKAWWEAQNEPDKDKPSDFKPSDTAWSEKMSQLLEDADSWRGRNDVWRNRFKLFDDFSVEGNTFSVPGYSYTLSKNTVEENDGVQLAYMQMGAARGTDPTKSDYNPFYASFANNLVDWIWSSKNLGEWDKTVQTHIDNLLPDVNHDYDNMDLATSKDIMSNIMKVGSVQAYRAPTVYSMRQEAKQYDDLVNVLREYEQTGSADFAKMNQALFQMYNPYFGETFGTFGTDEWKQNMVDYMYNADGGINEQHVAMFLQIWNQLNRAFDMLAPSKKAVLAPYLDRDMWESLLPSDYSLPDGGIRSLHSSQTYGYNTAQEKFIKKNYTNIYGQEDVAWFRVNGNGTVDTKPYFGTDVISEIRTSSSLDRWNFSGKSFILPLDTTSTSLDLSQMTKQLKSNLIAHPDTPGNIPFTPNINPADLKLPSIANDSQITSPQAPIQIGNGVHIEHVDVHIDNPDNIAEDWGAFMKRELRRALDTAKGINDVLN